MRVKTKKYVFLTHYGIMLKHFLLIKRTLPNAWYFKKPNAGFIFQFYRKVIEIYLVCRFGKSLKYKTLDPDKNYLFIYSPWFGYFSWVTETLPRIIRTESQHEKLTLIVPESWGKKRFVKDSIIFSLVKKLLYLSNAFLHIFWYKLLFDTQTFLVNKEQPPLTVHL